MMQQVWDEYTDPDMKNVWLLSSYWTYPLLSLTTFCLILVSDIITRNSRNKSTTDYRPFALLYSGFFFGVYGIGLPLLYVTTRGGSDLFACDAMPHNRRDIASSALKYLLSSFLMLMVVDMGIFIVRILNRKRIQMHQLIHHTVWMIVLSYAIVLHPVGFTIFAAACHVTNKMIGYAFLVLCFQHPKLCSMRPAIDFIEISFNLLTSLHHGFFLTQSQCGNPFTLSLIWIYCSLRASFLTVGFTSRYMSGKKALVTNNNCKQD